MSQRVVLLDAASIRQAVAQMARKIATWHRQPAAVTLVGIQRGGVLLAERLGHLLEQQWGHLVPIGRLDISMHRDDLDRRAAPPIYPTVIPFDINGKTVILVDDVLFNGRTTRAALDALNDFGRPQRIQLAVLIDRGHRELPIRADFIGQEIATDLSDTVQVELQDANGKEAVYLEKA
jgi:pyrimidine operon attenuation protein / uracil phosphoribosyltransferase